MRCGSDCSSAIAVEAEPLIAILVRSGSDEYPQRPARNAWLCERQTLFLARLDLVPALQLLRRQHRAGEEDEVRPSEDRVVLR